MSKTIWKFELLTTDMQAIEMPVDSEILAVQAQHNQPCIWAMVDPEAETGNRHFEIFGTGRAIPEDMGIIRQYIGTYQVEGVALVFHVFERL